MYSWLDLYESYMYSLINLSFKIITIVYITQKCTTDLYSILMRYIVLIAYRFGLDYTVYTLETFVIFTKYNTK